MRSRPSAATWDAGLCIRGWKGVSPQKNLQVATAGGEPQRKKRPWQRAELQSNSDHAGIFKLSPSLSGVAKHCSNTFKSADPSPFLSRSNACKVGLHTDPSSCEQPSKCVSPQSQRPTEGCGVIPVEGRGVCIDADPGGFLSTSELRLILTGLTVLLDTTDYMPQGLLRSTPVWNLTHVHITFIQLGNQGRAHTCIGRSCSLHCFACLSPGRHELPVDPSDFTDDEYHDTLRTRLLRLLMDRCQQCHFKSLSFNRI